FVYVRVFLLLLGRPPSPPLFPYTTLFRSDRGAVAPGGDAAAADRAQRLRLPLGVGDDDHDHLRLLRGADRTRAARPHPGVAVHGLGPGRGAARVRPPVPGRTLAQRRGRRNAAGDRVAARPGHRLPAAGGTLVLDAAAGGGVLPELRRGRAVACAARGRPAARTLPRAAAGPG